MTRPIAAVTGGTGFLGRYVIAALAQAGWQVRLLTRRDPIRPLPTDPLELVPGDLGDRAALSRLVQGASAVIHAAGLVKSLHRPAFFTVNRDGAARLAEVVARTAPRARFVLVSSLAARMPELSPYAGSKRAGEIATAAALGDGDWVVLRPCVIYGPGDWEGLALQRMARGWVTPVPGKPEPRIAMIHARDAAAAIVALSLGGPSHATFEISDERIDGYGWTELLRHTGAMLGRVPYVVPVPDLLIRAAGAASDAIGILAGRPSVFGWGKAHEILHRDWVSDLNSQPPRTLWRPTIDLRTGLQETVAWWRTNPDRGSTPPQRHRSALARRAHRDRSVPAP